MMKVRFQTLMKGLILAGIIFRVAALDSCGLWLDEAWQFWISKGVRPEYIDTIGAQAGDTSLTELLKNTRTTLLGSPTFTIFIHYWSGISNSVFWLRIIPCIFGIGVLPLMYLIAKECGFSKKWALAIVAFCSWNGPWVYYSIELRAYSFEIFCSALTLFFLVRILKNGSILRTYVWLALSVLLGMTSGHGYLIYYPFFVVFLILYVLIEDKDSDRRKFFKVLVITALVVIYVSYVTYYKLTRPMMLGFQPPYLTYLSRYLGDGLSSYSSNAVRVITYTISWQLFKETGAVPEPNYYGLNVADPFILPVADPFKIISALFLAYLAFIFIRALRRKNVVECAVLGAVIYPIVILTALSTMGSGTMSPTRHTLFFSPALFISFFICTKYVYGTIKRGRLRIREDFFLTLLLVILLTPNIHGDYTTVTWSKYRDDMRSALEKIQETVKKDDDVCVSVNWWGVYVLNYEHRYSNIPWIRALDDEDIVMDIYADLNHFFSNLSFRADANSGYDYQWYIFSDVHENCDILNISEVHIAKAQLEEGYGIIVDKEFFLPRAKVACFRARVRDVTGNP